MKTTAKTTAIAFGVAAGLLMATPAFAFQCPAMMAAIDDALPQASLSEADRERVVELRQQGEAAHGSGDHSTSETLLAEAMEILGID